MRALVLDGEPRLVGDHPEPTPGPDEAVVRVRMAGICDTDLQLVGGYMGYRGVLGHEMVGQVEEDGSALAGQRVVADINAGCGHCPDCVERDGHHCSGRTVLGIAGRAGVIADRVAIPRRCLVPVPDEIPDDHAVFAEPLAAGLHVLDELPADMDGPVIVLGDGKLGLLIAFALRGAGVAVHVVGHHRDNLALAGAVGATTSLEDQGAVAPASLVVEATGSTAGLALALRLTRPRGTIVLKTTVADPHAIDLSPLVIHEQRLVGSRCGDMHRVVRTLAGGTIDPTPLIAARYPLPEAEAALDHAARTGTLKILVDMR